MKKLIPTLTVVIMLLSVLGTAIADYPDEILFRKTPWGKSYDFTIKALSGTGLKWNSPSKASGRKIKSQANGSWSDYYDYDCLYYTYTAYNSPQITVAGYNVKSVYLYFAFTQDNAGRVPQDAEHTAFYMAKYTIDPVDMDAVFDDLRAKLTSLYGAPGKIESDGFIITYNYCYWYGANDTMVMLVDDDNYQDVYICYVWNGGERLMEKANAALHQVELDSEAELFGTDNTDGL